jgi:hypothetical protein
MFDGAQPNIVKRLQRLLGSAKIPIGEGEIAERFSELLVQRFDLSREDHIGDRIGPKDHPRPLRQDVELHG